MKYKTTIYSTLLIFFIVSIMVIGGCGGSSTGTVTVPTTAPTTLTTGTLNIQTDMPGRWAVLQSVQTSGMVSFQSNTNQEKQLDENGNASFSNVPLNNTYTVSVYEDQTKENLLASRNINFTADGQNETVNQGTLEPTPTVSPSPTPQETVVPTPTLIPATGGVIFANMISYSGGWNATEIRPGFFPEDDISGLNPKEITDPNGVTHNCEYYKPLKDPIVEKYYFGSATTPVATDLVVGMLGKPECYAPPELVDKPLLSGVWKFQLGSYSKDITTNYTQYVDFVSNFQPSNGGNVPSSGNFNDTFNVSWNSLGSDYRYFVMIATPPGSADYVAKQLWTSGDARNFEWGTINDFIQNSCTASTQVTVPAGILDKSPASTTYNTQITIVAFAPGAGLDSTPPFKTVWGSTSSVEYTVSIY